MGAFQLVPQYPSEDTQYKDESPFKLMEPGELEARSEMPDYKASVMEKAVQIRKELDNAVHSLEAGLEEAIRRAERAREVGYGRTELEKLERAEANRLQDMKRATDALANFPQRVHFVEFPVKKYAWSYYIRLNVV